MAQIFISHVKEDKELAIAIASGLEKAEYTTWYYEENNVPGQSYLENVVKGIDEAQVLLLIVSPNTLQKAKN